MPELLADLGAAGLARQHHFPTEPAQTPGEPLDLRGFAAAFAAFKSQEQIS
jgi:hypothetical protein